MKLLLVDDNPDDLALNLRELGRLGHELIPASNGVDALAAFEREHPDVVFTDIFMPGMDGFALTEAIQRQAAPHWQPVIFLSDHRDDGLQARALQVGAEAFLVKPISGLVLEAKLRTLERLTAMQRHAAERTHALERYHKIEEEEKRIARHLFDRLVSSARLDDPALHHWVLSATGFPGDIVAAARTPANVLHVMLADGTGHGLAASINVLPIAPPFYSMTEKGFSIDTIARELNAKVRQLLPCERIVAATLASIDFREGLIKLWNGGNPESVLIDAAGHPEHVFSHSSLPLGAREDSEFSPMLESVSFSEGSQLAVFSDGLPAVEDPAGHAFGHEGIAAALLAAPSGTRLACLQMMLASHLGTAAARDDISLLLVDCRRDQSPYRPPPSTISLPRLSSPNAARPGGWSFALRLGAGELQRLDVVPVLLNLANHFEDARPLGGKLFVILSEFFNNALDHGLLQLDSRLKLAPEGMGVYLDYRAQRLAGLSEGEIEIHINHVQVSGGAALRISCRDSGPGFNHSARQAEDADARYNLPFGRGIDLARSLCLNLCFNEAGNEAVAILALGHQVHPAI